MFRLPESFLDELLIGRRIERDITLSEVLPIVRLEPFCIYIDVLAIDNTLPQHLRHLYAGVLVSRLIDVIINLLANGYLIEKIYTVTTNKEGSNLVTKLGFQYMEGKSIARSRTAYEYPLNEQTIQHLRVAGRANMLARQKRLQKAISSSELDQSGENLS